MEPYIRFDHVCKQYRAGEVVIQAADDVSFEVGQGEFCVIVGPSGAGKTTILNMLGGMDPCDSGTITLDGREISAMNARELTRYRRSDVGFVFQFYNLVPNLTALENVELACEICEDPLSASDLLKQVGLNGRLDSFPAQLSGGEQQRVAIARAMAKNPKLLLCDEPTGALDYSTGKSILRQLKDTCVAAGKTVVLITHNQAIAAMADRVIHVKNGAVSGVQRNESPMPVERIEW